jgi:hypothetical protein
VCLPHGAVDLVASPVNSGFELGPTPWVSISGADGGASGPTSGTLADGGTDGGAATSTTTVTLGSAPGCVLLCCPFTNGTGCNDSFAGFGGDAGFTAMCP